MTPKGFMKKLINYLATCDYNTNGAGFDNALSYISNGYYTFWQSAIDEIKASIKTIAGDAAQSKDFLLTHCHIDLSNTDNGSLLGLNVNGGNIFTDLDVIDETGELQKLSEDTFKYNNLTFTFSENLSAKEKNIKNILYTWCLPLALDKVKDSLDLTTTNFSMQKEMPVYFFDSTDTSKKVYVDYSYVNDTDNSLSYFSLNINTNDGVYGKITDGNSTSAVAEDNIPFDIAVTHEIVNALMLSNMKLYPVFPAWFIEGSTANLVHGYETLNPALLLKCIQDGTTFDNGLLTTSTQELSGAVGYIIMRYILAKCAVIGSSDYTPVDNNDNVVYTLHELLEKFKEFVQGNYQNTQPWELVRDRLDETDNHVHPFGMTFKIPNTVDKNYPAFLSINWENITRSTYANATDQSINMYFTYPYNTHRLNCFGVELVAVPQRNNNIFYDTGELAYFSLHTKYEDRFYSYEQPGSSTEYESLKWDINYEGGASGTKDVTSNGKNYNFWKIHLRRPPCGKGYCTDFLDEPVRFPGLGSAMLTISDGNKADSRYTGIRYWFTKTDRSATITTCVFDKYYQSVTFGFLDKVDERYYPLPLYIGGGTTGLMLNEYIFQPCNPDSCPVIVRGNNISLDVTRKEFTNGNILNTSKFNDSHATSFRVRRPSGIWDNYNNFIQTPTVTNHYICYCGKYPRCYIEPHTLTLGSPPYLDTSSTARIYPRDIGFNFHEVRTTAVNKYKKYEYDTVLGQGSTSFSWKMKNDISFAMLPILPYMTNHTEPYRGNASCRDDDGFTGIMGQVPGQFAAWDKSNRHGVQDVSGKKYLFVPAGYTERLLQYPIYNGIYNVFPYEEEIKAWFDGLFRDSNMIYSTLVIPLDTNETRNRYVSK